MADLFKTPIEVGPVTWQAVLAGLLATLTDNDDTPAGRNAKAIDIIRGVRPVPVVDPAPDLFGEAAQEPGTQAPGLSELLAEASAAISLLTLGQALQGGVDPELPARLARSAGARS